MKWLTEDSDQQATIVSISGARKNVAILTNMKCQQSAQSRAVGADPDLREGKSHLTVRSMSLEKALRASFTWEGRDRLHQGYRVHRWVPPFNARRTLAARAGGKMLRDRSKNGNNRLVGAARNNAALLFLRRPRHGPNVPPSFKERNACALLRYFLSESWGGACRPLRSEGGSSGQTMLGQRA
jgi:hypothetical protein